MGRVIYDLWDDDCPEPKRGDVMQSNVGDKRERTWLIARVRRVARKDKTAHRRFEILMFRWWELEAETRMRLFRCAERHSRQNVFELYRNKRKKKTTFEEYMRRVV